ncbi:MAG: hypothetical protein KF891_05170 [Rhizobacter sp.]|nr:hypothetical protein [Rhizobacter sp.]
MSNPNVTSQDLHNAANQSCSTEIGAATSVAKPTVKEALELLVDFALTSNSDEAKAAAKLVASLHGSNGFRFNPHDLQCLNGRHSKAMTQCLDAVRMGRTHLYELISEGEIRMRRILQLAAYFSFRAPISKMSGFRKKTILKSPDQVLDDSIERWDADRDGAPALREALAYRNPLDIRLVGTSLTLSGFTRNEATAWLSRTIPNYSEQAVVCDAWEWLEFRCGSAWVN